KQGPDLGDDPERTMMTAEDVTESVTLGQDPGAYRQGAKLESGTMLGRYRITRLLGEGGMGAVYEAEQDLPHRTVALKVIKPGLSRPQLLHRFEQESQALGRLQHVGIAQI